MVYYSSLGDAVSAWTDGSTLKLLADVGTDATITVPAGTHNLDLNGHGIKMTGSGSAVSVSSGATLNLYDGDAELEHKFTVSGSQPNGAGLATVDDGLTSGYKTFTGGYITGGNGSLAGGVGVDEGGTFNMYGGSIIGNQTSVHGGGVGVSGPGGKTAVFNMYGGSICYNSSAWGGGVNIFANAYINEGCSIHHNTATNGGGGIELESGGKLYMNGGSVTDNIVLSQNGGMWKGGGIHLPNGTECHFRGKVQIKNNYQETAGTKQNNLFIRQEVPGKAIIDAALTADALIGVGTNGAVPFVITTDYGKYHGASDLESYFISDNEEYKIRLNADGEACLTDANLSVEATDYEGDYDGNAHSITVSVPDGATVKYGETEGNFTLDENPSYTNAGTYTVYYEVSKAYYNSVSGSATVKINPIDASLTDAPLANNDLIFNGSEQELINEGAVSGGTLYYAIGDDYTVSPGEEEYKTQIPAATKVGSYFVWYKVKGDENHNDISPAYLKVTLAAEDWVTVSGVISDKDGAPIGNANVDLMQGNKVVDKIESDSEGRYYFTVPAGIYNIVVRAGEATIKNIVDVSENTDYDASAPVADNDSILDVVDSDKSIVVGGLDAETDAVRKSESIPDDKNVTVRMTVKAITEDATEGARAIDESAKDKNLEFYDLKVEKTVDSETSTLEETQNVMEFVIPCAYTSKKELSVYNYSGVGVQSLAESNSKESGTYRVDKNNGFVYVYLNRFSTIAMGYKPYFHVESSVSLGSFTGNVSVTLEKDGSGEKYELNNVSLENISFSGIPKGTYSMTVTWKDGAENTLTVPFTIK